MKKVSKLIYLTDGKRHLICVPYTIPNLHQMAKELGIGAWWFHKNHYDIPLFAQESVEKRCRKIDSKEIVEIIRHPEYASIIIGDEVKGNACPKDYFLMTDLQYKGFDG